MRLAFVGDVSLNGEYCQPTNYTKKNRFFSQIRKFLDERKIDFLIGNLESPLKGTKQNILKDPRLYTSLQTITTLKSLLPAGFNLANNHIFDCLEDGFFNTKKWLIDNKFVYFGAGLKRKEAQKAFTLPYNHSKITILSYVAHDTHPSLPENSDVHLNFLEPQRILAEIKKHAQKSLVIIILHWGVEFSHYPSPEQRELAHSFIEAGARLVIGHHSHALQGVENWDNGYIFYSLGNFAFADVLTATNPVLWTRDQLHGGIALIDIENNKIKNVELIPTHINNLEVKIENNRVWHDKIKKRCTPLMLSTERYKHFWKRYYFFEFTLKRPFKYFFGERKTFLKQLIQLITYIKVSFIKLIKI